MPIHSRVFATALIGIAGALTSGAFAQSVLDLGQIEGHRVSVALDDDTRKVGGAALVRVVGINSTIKTATAPLLLVACNGSWMSTTIQAAFKLNKVMTHAEMLSYAKSQDEALPLDAIGFTTPRQNKLFFAEALAKRASAICKAAGKEPRNLLIPVAETRAKDETGSTSAIVLGTSSRVAGAIEVWIRTTHYRIVPVLDKDGKPWEFAGKVETSKQITGKYSLDRRAFDCKNRTIAILASSEYESEGSPAQSWSQPRDKIEFISVVPESVGELQLDAVCTIYG